MKPATCKNQNGLKRAVSTTLLSAFFGISILAAHSFGAIDITGNPLNDSWAYIGNSVASSNFNYQSGGAIYSADIYTIAFTLTSSSPLFAATTWTLGDTIIGIGGVFTASNNSSLTYSGTGGATSTRFILKYGSPDATWQPNSTSTSVPEYGSLANGGVGSVLLGSSAYAFSPANSGQFLVPDDTPSLQLSGSTTAIDPSVGRDITLWSDAKLTGFETFLDLTLLKQQVPMSNVQLGNQFILGLQRGSAAYQDSVGTLPASVPEPGVFVLVGGGVAALSLHRRRRQS